MAGVSFKKNTQRESIHIGSIPLGVPAPLHDREGTQFFQSS
jgi:hypothetical protein